ncbi:hypothetical protein KC19_VG056400 [Ceratodon purpureus]|uniref:Uncharacterized protein n=1 Tax=Ceratodon purpureus TaxID=3225 RepID=A0A8T0HMU5_CERPU|nr:hypothetical protein KC19_VG056400 [Ceratodon purpureus]
MLYRMAVEEVLVDDYTLPLSSAEVMRKGSDITLAGWVPMPRWQFQAFILSRVSACLLEV